MLGIKKILIICQRKQTETNDKIRVETTNQTIQQYVDKLYPNFFKKYDYMTSGLTNDNITTNFANYMFDLDPTQTKSFNFIKEKYHSYDIIILNTCPLPFFNVFFYYSISKLLTKNGIFLILAINEKIIENSLEIYRNFNIKINNEIDQIFYNGPENIDTTNFIIKNLVQIQLPERKIIQSLFEWKNINNEPVLILRTEPNPQYMQILIQELCKNMNNNLFKLLPYIVQLIFRNTAKYCINKNKGNIILANQINQISLF
jgi:hypothetical protein